MKFIRFMREKLGNSVRIDAPLSFEWCTVWFASGIALYFCVPFEPDWRACLTVIGVLFLLYKRIDRDVGWRANIVLVLLLMSAGFGRSVWHSRAANAPILPEYERAYLVEGWVKSETMSGNRKRWEIVVAQIEGLTPEETPVVIRTIGAGDGVRVGDFIRIRSILSAPPGPAVPGGYDPARRAYFDQVGGYGFSVSRAEVLEGEVQSFGEKLRRKIVTFRYDLARRVVDHGPAQTSGLQAGLLTGIRRYIPPEQTEALRAAGLAHILAISGLHMGLLAGGVYFLATLGLACVSPLSRRLDVRKPAAIIGAMAAIAYLVVSGASVATQRAFIMAIIVFLAVLLDRQAVSMRSVALAALITLLWHPEALTGAGFQMSFAAVAALVVVYRNWEQVRKYEVGVWRRFRQSLISLSVTSLVAGLATSGFAILHFNRMATYGLAGNLLAMPIFTFWVMPAAITVFPALLIGHEAAPLWVMGQGLDLILKISSMVESWEGAIAHIASAPSWVVGLYGFAFTALCLGRLAVRILGVFLVGVCFSVWLAMPSADLRISSNGDVAMLSSAAPDTLYVGRKRADSFGREQFARRAGASMSELKSFKDLGANCDPFACRLALHGKTISITDYPSEVSTECASSDLVILTQRRAGPVSARQCQAVLIDEKILRSSGSLDVYLKATKIRIKAALPLSRSNRPWGQSPPY